MAHGTVKWFDARRGFGFISRAGFVSRDAGGADVFVHQSQIAGPSRGFGPGELVTFTLERHPHGLRAADVSAAGV
jgi:CspA family cold shock protein